MKYKVGDKLKPIAGDKGRCGGYSGNRNSDHIIIEKVLTDSYIYKICDKNGDLIEVCNCYRDDHLEYYKLHSNSMLQPETNLIKGLSEPIKSYMLLGWMSISGNEYMVTEIGKQAMIQVMFGLTTAKTLEEYAISEIKRIKSEEKKK